MAATIVLASTSRYRRELLERLKIPFETAAPDVDEAHLHSSGRSPRAIAEELAVAKARSVQQRFPDAIIIGSDQVAELEGKLLNKPGTLERARLQLAQLSGKEHTLLTAVAILNGNSLQTHTDVTRMRCRALSSEEIARYVDADRPVDCAGSYKIESLGIALFEAIDSADASAITGLPLLFVAGALRALGWRIP